MVNMELSFSVVSSGILGTSQSYLVSPPLDPPREPGPEFFSPVKPSFALY